MRPPEEMRRPPSSQGPNRSNRRRILAAVAVAILIVVFTSLRGIARFWTDFLWFDALGFGAVFTRVLWARFVLGAVFAVVFFVLVYVNLLIADRLAPRFRPPGPEEELVERWHAFIGGRTGLVRIVVSALFALIAGAGVSSRWEQWLLFTNSVDFGIEDPQFGRDAGFYVFRLPFLSFVVSWLFAAMVIIFITTAVAHYLNGGIRLQTRGERVTPQVKAHLSLLLGLLALIKAAGYYYDRFELTLSTRGFRDGASFTDVNAQLPAINLLILISLFSFGLLVFNIRRRGWTYPAIAVGLWAVVAVVAGSIYPAFIQRFSVEPSESTREAPFIERNIEATRFAMGLADVEERTFDFEDELSAGEVAANLDSITNVRLLDPGIVNDTFQRLEGFKSFYDFRDIDVDRYLIDGELTQVVLSARELNSSGLVNRSWESDHLRFTHGYGLAVAPANESVAGEPNFVLENIPAEVNRDAPGLELTQPGLYYGEDLGSYSIVGAEVDEIDFETESDETVNNRYIDDGGTGGVGIGNIVRRAAFALRFAEWNLFISGQLGEDSRILYLRDISQRAEELAPFLAYDADPYPVIQDGRVVWLLDAYTTTDRYPYAQRADTSTVRSDSGLRRGFNYVRNSVKVAIDAYTGDVTFWVIDPDDPMLRAYRKIFPELFSDNPPESLQAHFRYPEDLFRVQTDTWARYRLEDPARFYTGGGAWAVAQDPGDRIGQLDTEQFIDEETQTIVSREVRIAPQYLLQRLPGDEETSFLLFRPFVPFSPGDQRRNLEAFMVARSDPGSYGRLEVFDVQAQSVLGPVEFAAEVNTQDEIAQQITLLNRDGSQVLVGNLLLIPVENSIVYVRPLYVAATTGTEFPQLRQVIVGANGRVVMEETFEEALTAAIGAPIPGFSDVEQVSTPAPDPDPDPAPGDTDPPDDGSADGGTPDDGSELPPLPDEADALLREADRLFDEANRALAAGDLAGYQSAIDQAQAAVERALAILEAAAAEPPADDGGASDEGEGEGDGGGAEA